MHFEVAKNINDLLKSRNLTQVWLSEKLGVSQSAVSKWLSANKKTNNNIPVDKVIEISKLFDVSTELLLGIDVKRVTKNVPLIGKASCGIPKEYDLNGYESVPVEDSIYRNGMYAVIADGDSMSPKINDGDILYCCPNSQIDSNNIVHYFVNGNSGIKRYKINEAGTIITLVPVNSEYDIITIHCDENVDIMMSKVVARIDKNF